MNEPLSTSRNNRSRNRGHRQLSRSRSREKDNSANSISSTNDKHFQRSNDNREPLHGKSPNATSTLSFTTNKIDPNLPQLNDDPRSSDPSKRITSKALSQSKGRNTESFHADSTFVRPDLRIQIGSNKCDKYNKKLKHDDVVIVPELFGAEDDWTIYYKLVEEMREIQDQERNASKENNHDGTGGSRKQNSRNNGAKSEWIPWHEGAHLISKKPDDSTTFQSIIKRLCTYFDIDTNKPVGTRFNWYRDSNDWKVRITCSNYLIL